MNDLEFWSIKQLRTTFHGQNKFVESIPEGQSAGRMRQIVKRIIRWLGFGKSPNWQYQNEKVEGEKRRKIMKRRIYLKFWAFLLISCLLSSVSKTAAQTEFRVEGAGVEASPNLYNGACPGVIKFTAKIQANGKGRVKYTWLRNDGATSPVEYLDFTQAEVKYVSTAWTLGDASVLPRYSGWQQIKILSPNEYLSNKAEFKLVCSQAVNPPEKKVENEKKAEGEFKFPDAKSSLPKPDAPDCRTLPGGCPSEQNTARFRITINGFKTNHRTNDKFLDEDGAKDEVFLRTDASLYDRSTSYGQPMRQSPVFGDNNRRPERIRAGRASSIGGGNGGFEDGDGFPSSSPWVRVSAPNAERPPLVVWEGDLTRDSNALALIPSIWESDEDSFLLNHQWTRAVAQTFDGIQSEMHLAISRRSGFQSSNSLQNQLARFFDNVRIPNAENNDLDRPIGMSYRGGQYGYDPKMLVLTYDAAERIVNSDSGFGEGIIELNFKDNDGLVGNYTVFLQVEKLNQNGSCASDLATTFNGTATMTTSHPNARGPFSQPISLGVGATNCRSTVSINHFPPISVTFQTPVGENTATLTLIGGGTGALNRSNGRLEIPVHLSVSNSHPWGGVSTIELTLSTEGAGGMRKSSGDITLVGSGTFRGGFLDGQTGSFTVTGSFSPSILEMN